MVQNADRRNVKKFRVGETLKDRDADQSAALNILDLGSVFLD